MWSIRGNVDCRTRPENLLCAAKGELQFALEQGECLFEVVPMGRRASSWRNVHIDEAEAARCVIPGQEDGVGVANHSDVRKLSVTIGLCNCEGTVEVVCRDRRTGTLGLIQFRGHGVIPYGQARPRIRMRSIVEAIRRSCGPTRRCCGRRLRWGLWRAMTSRHPARLGRRYRDAARGCHRRI